MKYSINEARRQVWEKLQAKATALYRRGVPSDGTWTREFKLVLRSIGKQYGFQVWSSGKVFDLGEWLFDLCWAKSEDPWESFKGLALACEIEWDRTPGGVYDDFYKLTVCDADLLLIVFACKDKDNPRHRLRDLRMRSRRCSTDKQFLGIAVPDSGPRLFHLSWTT